MKSVITHHSLPLFLAVVLVGIGGVLGVFTSVYAQTAPTQTKNAIEAVIPQSGGAGQYVTITGKHFGTVPGKVSFVQNGVARAADVSFPSQCAKLWWRPSALVVKVPTDTAQGAQRITVQNAQGEKIGDASFTVTLAAPTPGLCGMVPDNGPLSNPVTLHGERLGERQGRVTVGAEGTAEIAENGWSTSAIQLQRFAAFSGAETVVRTVTADGTLSNPLIFTSGRCSASNQCGDGTSCCGDGSCRPSGMCEEVRAQCTFSWSFYTGALGDVGAACQSGAQCLSGVCTEGRCALGKAAVGETCAADVHCASGLCVNNVCAETKKGIGEKCENDQQCNSGSCADNRCIAGTKKYGAACMHDDQCTTLNCSDGVCGQTPRCLRVEKIEPTGVAIRQNSVFSVSFNQLVDEQTAKRHIRLSPSVEGTYEFLIAGKENDAKSTILFTPKNLLSRQQTYRVQVGDGVKAAHSANTLHSCVDVGIGRCTRPGEQCTAAGSVCTNGATCSGNNSTCSGEGTTCTGNGSTCVQGADCSTKNAKAQPDSCWLGGAKTSGALRQSHRVLVSLQSALDTIVRFAGVAWNMLSRVTTMEVFATAHVDQSQPTNVVLTKDDEQRAVTVKWDYTPSEEFGDYQGFEIHRNPPYVVRGQEQASIDVGKQQRDYIDRSLEPNVAYQYKIRAFRPRSGGGRCTENGDCQSGVCTLDGLCTDPVVPEAPTGLRTTRVTTNQIDLSWNYTSQNFNRFILERSTNGRDFSALPDAPSDPDNRVHADTGLSPFTRYWYRVRAKNAVGESPYSNVVNAITRDANFCTDTEPVLHPSQLSLSVESANTIRATWERGGTNETAFELQRAEGETEDDKAFARVVGIPATDAGTYSHRDQTLVPGRTYTYRVIASNCKAQSDPGPPLSAQTKSEATTTPALQTSPTTPNTPTNFTAVGTTAAEILLTWIDNATNEENYILERSGDGTIFTGIEILGTDTTSHTDKALSRNTTYYYRLSAVNAAGTSDAVSASAKTKLITICFRTRPSAPTLTGALALSDRKIKLSWQDTSNNETDFVVERSSDNTTFEPIAALQSGTLSYTDSANLQPSTTYYYRVKAHNCKGDSEPSSVLNTTTRAEAGGGEVTPPSGPRCGDGIVQPSRGEECDPGSLRRFSTCDSSTCKAILHGTGFDPDRGDGSGGEGERRNKTDPSNPDADGDGLLDGVDSAPNDSTQPGTGTGTTTGSTAGGGGSLPPGSSCTQNAQCTSASCQNGVCVGLSVGSQCTQNNQCASQSCQNGICVGLSAGSQCTQNNQCASQSCQNGVCVGLSAGSQCTQNAQCTSASCQNGVCSGSDTSGTSGTKNYGEQCSLHAECKSGLCFNGRCDEDKDKDDLPRSVDPDDTNPDTDGDGLRDGQEDTNKNGKRESTETDPTNPDTDGDKWSDGCDPAPLDPNQPGPNWKGKTTSFDFPIVYQLIVRGVVSIVHRTALLFTIYPAFAEEEPEREYSEWSENVSTTISGAMNAPTNVTAINTSDNQTPRVRIAWTDTNQSAFPYELQRMTVTNGNPGNFESVTTQPGTSYDDGAVAFDTTYRYQMRAVDTQNNRESAFVTSSDVTPTKQAPPGSGAAPALAMYPLEGAEALTADTLSCAGPGCPPDSTTRSYRARLYDSTDSTRKKFLNDVGYTFTWAVSDEMRGDGTAVTAAGEVMSAHGTQQTAAVTAREYGSATLTVTARKNQETPLTATITLSICGVPWEHAVNVLNTDYDVRFTYCRGSNSDAALPNLQQPIVIDKRRENRYFEKEFFLRIDPSNLGRESQNSKIKSDVIIIGVARSEWYSPLTWYQLTIGRVPTLREPVNGYPAVSDATGTYILAMDSEGSIGLRTSGPTIYYFATNTGAQPATREILNQIIAHARFSKNLSYDEPLNSEGAHVRRDFLRMHDFEIMRGALARYARTNNTFPDLAAGSYVKYQTISAWPSWENELGAQLGLGKAIPRDPYPWYNAFCATDKTDSCIQKCTQTGYDARTCWKPRSATEAAVFAFQTSNQDDVEAAINDTSIHGYSYSFNTANRSFRFCGRFEFFGIRGSMAGNRVYCMSGEASQLGQGSASLPLPPIHPGTDSQQPVISSFDVPGVVDRDSTLTVRTLDNSGYVLSVSYTVTKVGATSPAFKGVAQRGSGDELNTFTFPLTVDKVGQQLYGPYTIAVVAEDEAGNKAEDSRTILVNRQPIVDRMSVTYGDDHKDDLKVESSSPQWDIKRYLPRRIFAIIPSVSDPDNAIAGKSTVHTTSPIIIQLWKWNGNSTSWEVVPHFLRIGPVDGNFAFNDINSLQNGDYQVRITVKDEHNWVSPTRIGQFHLSNTPPTVTILTDTIHASNASYIQQLEGFRVRRDFSKHEYAAEIAVRLFDPDDGEALRLPGLLLHPLGLLHPVQDRYTSTSNSAIVRYFSIPLNGLGENRMYPFRVSVIDREGEESFAESRLVMRDTFGDIAIASPTSNQRIVQCGDAQPFPFSAQVADNDSIEMITASIASATSVLFRDEVRGVSRTPFSYTKDVNIQTLPLGKMKFTVEIRDPQGNPTGADRDAFIDPRVLDTTISEPNSVDRTRLVTGRTVSFKARTTPGIDGGNNRPTGIRWSINGGILQVPLGGIFATDYHESSYSHAFSQAGSYTVTVHAYDVHCPSTAVTDTITVNVYDPGAPQLDGGWSDQWISATANSAADGTGGTCSAACGGGWQNKICNDPSPDYAGGAECSREGGTFSEAQDTPGTTSTQNPTTNQSNRLMYKRCNTHVCPVDGEWSPWNTCSKSCDDGSGPGTHARTCQRQQGTGRECTRENGSQTNTPGGDITETRPCNRGSCPYWLLPTACVPKDSYQCDRSGFGGTQTQTCTVPSDQELTSCSLPSGSTPIPSSKTLFVAGNHSFECILGTCPSWGSCGLDQTSYNGVACGIGKETCEGGSSTDGRCVDSASALQVKGSTRSCSLPTSCPLPNFSYSVMPTYGNPYTNNVVNGAIYFGQASGNAYVSQFILEQAVIHNGELRWDIPSTSTSYTTGQTISTPGGYYRLSALNPYSSLIVEIKFSVGHTTVSRGGKTKRDQVGNQCSFHTPPPTVAGETCQDNPRSCERPVTLCPFNQFFGTCNQILKTDGTYSGFGATWEEVYYTTVNCAGAGTLY